MSLIAETKKLRELEQQAEPDWFRGDAGNIYCKSLRKDILYLCHTA
mgnify:CR=1 FL=1